MVIYLVEGLIFYINFLGWRKAWVCKRDGSGSLRIRWLIPNTLGIETNEWATIADQPDPPTLRRFTRSFGGFCPKKIRKKPLIPYRPNGWFLLLLTCARCN